MFDFIESAIVRASLDVFVTLQGFLITAVFFSALGIILHRKNALKYFRKTAPQMKLNLEIAVFNVVFIVPVLVFAGLGLANIAESLGIGLVPKAYWDSLPIWLAVLITLLFGDFVVYWRHRWQHSDWLWPSHAIHHSDTDLTWISTYRSHPLNRATSYLIDGAALILIGAPDYALVVFYLVRQYYTEFIHANLPWTYGPLGRVFVSPAMHRWHHAEDPDAYNSNFAGIFSIWDQMFGTYYVPGPCNAPLGIGDEIKPNLVGQLAYPFEPRAYRHLFGRSDGTASEGEKPPLSSQVVPGE
ncbi:MAG: sterol desaturase family protein [Pseudomonadota bacterium]